MPTCREQKLFYVMSPKSFVSTIFEVTGYRHPLPMADHTYPILVGFCDHRFQNVKKLMNTVLNFLSQMQNCLKRSEHIIVCCYVADLILNYIICLL
jgi:hypothetical protein